MQKIITRNSNIDRLEINLIQMHIKCVNFIHKKITGNLGTYNEYVTRVFLKWPEK